jgi:hypothetical protein
MSEGQKQKQIIFLENGGALRGEKGERGGGQCYRESSFSISACEYEAPTIFEESRLLIASVND